MKIIIGSLSYNAARIAIECLRDGRTNLYFLEILIHDRISKGSHSKIKEYIRSAIHNKLETTNPTITFKFQLDPNLLNTECSSSHIQKPFALVTLAVAVREELKK